MAADTADEPAFHDNNHRHHASKASNGLPPSTTNSKSDIAYSGWLTHSTPDVKRSSRKRRFYVLSNRATISCYESEEELNNGSGGAKETFFLTPDSTVHKQSSSSGKHDGAFTIKTPSKDLRLKADSGAEDNIWIQHLQRVIEGLKSGRIAVPATQAPVPVSTASPASKLVVGAESSAMTLDKLAGTSQGVQQSALALPSTATPWGNNASSPGGKEEAYDSHPQTPEPFSPSTTINTPSLVVGDSSQKGTPKDGLSLMDTDKISQARTADQTDVESTAASSRQEPSETAFYGGFEQEKMAGRVKMSRRTYYLVLNGHQLDFYSSESHYTSKKPPSHTIVLTPDTTIESRKLPGKPKGPQKPVEVAFQEAQEPDSVIDVHLPKQIVTLQCFLVEEENRWISYLQLAVGALTNYEGGSSIGREYGLRGNGGLVPRACCVVS